LIFDILDGLHLNSDASICAYAYESYACQHNSSSAIEDNYYQDITSNKKFKKTDDAVQFAGNHGNLQQEYMNKHILKHLYILFSIHFNSLHHFFV
jgi:hypothetical protein